MKNWLKIFRSETVTASPGEIEEEIAGLKHEKESLLMTLKNIQTELHDTRLENLGGKDSTGAARKLQAQESELLGNIQALDTAIEKLKERHQTALAQEKDTELEKISRELNSLADDRAELLERFLKSAGETAALYCLLTGKNDVTVGRNTLSFLIPQNEREPMKKAFDRIMDGKVPYPHRHGELIARRNNIKGIKTTVNFLAAG